MRKIESSAKTNDSVLSEELGCRANSKGTVPPWVAGCVAHMLQRPEKHHDVRARSRMRKFRDVLTLDGSRKAHVFISSHFFFSFFFLFSLFS